MEWHNEKVFRDNIEAIKVVLNLEREGRGASQSEKEILERYKGFGGCLSILRQDSVKLWPYGEKRLFPLVEELWRVIDTVSDSSRKEAIIASLKRSVENSIGTPKEMTLSIGRGFLKSMRMDKGTPFRLLDPSSVTGNFLNLFDGHKIEGLSKTAYVPDILSGMIQKAIDPNLEVRESGFERLPLSEKGTYDLVLSHVPVGEFSVVDAGYAHGNEIERASLDKIADYYLLKGLDALREGGLLCFIADMDLLNNLDERPTREYLMRRSGLITAVPIPRSAFYLENGVEIDRALVILQKDSLKKTLSEKEHLFIESVEIDYEKMYAFMDGLRSDDPKYSERLHCPNRYVEDWLRGEEKSAHHYWVEPYLDTNEDGVWGIHYESYLYEEICDLLEGEETAFEELVRLDMEARYRPELLLREEKREPLNVLGEELISLPELFDMPEDEKRWKEMNAHGKRAIRGLDKDLDNASNLATEKNHAMSGVRKGRSGR